VKLFEITLALFNQCFKKEQILNAFFLYLLSLLPLLCMPQREKEITFPSGNLSLSLQVAHAQELISLIAED